MSAYSGEATVAGGQGLELVAVKAAICEEAVRRSVERYGGELRAIVLTGSLARDEATLLRQKGRSVVLGDAELLLVFSEPAALPHRLDTRAIARSVEEALAARGVVCHTTLAPVHPRYLRTLRPHIFPYELRECGQVLWGDTRVLSLIPGFPASQIPPEDAWRLLCNRLLEQLEILPRLVHQPAPLAPGLRYPTAKLYLDMATSYLVFAGAYEPTYARREERLRRLASGHGAADHALPIRRLAQRVTAATRWKLHGDDLPAASDLPWEESVADARSLWRWELQQLLGTSAELSDAQLLAAWMHRQPLTQRLRGWIHIARREEWRVSWRHWPRWARLARHGSPRYWVYAVACELIFQLPGLTTPPGDTWHTEPDCSALLANLPVLGELDHRSDWRGWRYLASEIAWNYRQFVVDTRA